MSYRSLMFLAMCVVACAPTAPTGWVTHTDANVDFSISFPETWKTYDNIPVGTAHAFVVTPPTEENVSAGRLDSIDHVVVIHSTQCSENPFTVEPETVTIGGRAFQKYTQGKTIIYMTSLGGSECFMLVTNAFEEDAAFDALLGQIAESFRIL